MKTNNSNLQAWHGVDADKETSLFEYGLLCRYVPKEKEYQCIYRNESGNMFSYGWANEKDLHDIFLTGFGENDKDSFLQTMDLSWEEWIAMPMASKIYDVMNHYTAMDVFGCDYSGGYTAKEICKTLKIKYYEEYDKAC